MARLKFKYLEHSVYYSGWILSCHPDVNEDRLLFAGWVLGIENEVKLLTTLNEAEPKNPLNNW